MSEHPFGHEGAFRQVQPLKLRRWFDLIEFDVCREVLMEEVKDGRLHGGGWIRVRSQVLKDIQRRGWMACEDPGWQDWETYLEEGAA